MKSFHRECGACLPRIYELQRMAKQVANESPVSAVLVLVPLVRGGLESMIAQIGRNEIHTLEGQRTTET